MTATGACLEAQSVESGWRPRARPGSARVTFRHAAARLCVRALIQAAQRPHTTNGSCPTRDVTRPGALLTPSHRPRLRTGHSSLLGGRDAHPATGGLLWPAPLVVVRPIVRPLRFDWPGV